MAAVAGRSGPWLPGARYGNLCMPAFRLSLRTAVTAPFIAVFVVTAGLLAAWQQRQVDQLINRESLRLLDSLSTDRKSTRLNSSHLVISYAVFCLKKTKQHHA